MKTTNYIEFLWGKKKVMLSQSFASIKVVFKSALTVFKSPCLFLVMARTVF